jgi:hypothetical protein
MTQQKGSDVIAVAAETFLRTCRQVGAGRMQFDIVWAITMTHASSVVDGCHCCL